MTCDATPAKVGKTATQAEHGAQADRAAAILLLLAEHGGWVSGEELSRVFGITRAAIAKHISRLRGLGNVIEAAPRRGYRLLVRNDGDDLAVPPPLPGCLVMGRGRWLFTEETTSTSNEAARLAMEGDPEGSLAIAERQSMGRGRKGKDWHSLPRSLQFSVVLRPSEPLGQELVCRMGAVCVAEALESAAGVSVRLKAPNDVLLNGRKLCGVLVEAGYRADERDWIVLGIGCNVNAVLDDIPAQLRGKITSLFLETGRETSRRLLLSAILARLEHWRGILEAGKAELLNFAWTERANQ